MNTTLHRERIAGVDGCRAGWVVTSRAGCFVVSELTSIVNDFDVIGIDMPIGLPQRGPRPCDRAARVRVRPRGSTVFPAPVRAALHCTTFAAAAAASRAAAGVGLPLQTFHLLPKIRELDVLAQQCPARFVEIHPECSFALLAGHVLAPKRTPEGRARRRELIAALYGDVPDRLPGARPDDVLDAYAVLWSAQRYASGTHETLGGDVDEVGLPMRIVI
jgi:predicted RNase H-like nuclease